MSTVVTSAPTDTRPTIWGAWMFAITALIAGSAFPALRIEVGDLQVHPNLIPLGIAFGLSLARVSMVPSRVLAAFGIFIALYAVSTLRGGFEAGEVTKLITACVMVVAAGVIPRNKKDVTAGIVGMVLAVGIISLRGMASVESEVIGANPLEDIANKNAFSVYALPALLLGGFYVLEGGASKLLKTLVIITSMLIVVTVFSTGNRSGWAGVFLVGLMLIVADPGRLGKLRGVTILLVLAALSYSAFLEWGSGEVVEHRVEQTMSGYRSDNYRWELFTLCMEIGAENPVLGVSPKGLGWELARRSMSDLGAVDSHNVIGHIFGGSGLLTLLALFWVGRALWTPFNAAERPTRGGTLLRLMILLWLARGMFTREVLYSPTFCLGMGLALSSLLQERLAKLAHAPGELQPDARTARPARASST